ncbi:MAG: hypothetical protein OEL69_10240 [Nitrosopumilus sp.]|nr:hypothetical protein [Nitrosopumilus sp.]
MILFDGVAFADIIPPKKQSSFGILSDDIVCESGMFKVIREGTNSIACVKTKNVLKLVLQGWAKPVDETALGVQLNNESISLGTINKLYAEPVKTQFGKLTPKSPASGYDFAFEVCASAQKIYVPDVLIKSDSETQHYEMTENIEPHTCVLSVTFIKAADPNSIKVSLLNKGDISKTLLDIESKVSSIQKELALARKSLGDKSSPDTTQGSKISDLRKQLNDAKEDLYKFYFTIHAVPKEKYNIQKLSFTGIPIEGEITNLITVKKAVTGDRIYDAVFETCAGKTQVRLPVITVSSDTETRTVNLGDRVAPNSCQMSSVKVTATDPTSIKVNPTDNSESGKKISDLENQISKLQKELSNAKELLRSLLHDPNRPSDFNEQVEMHSANIIQLRSQINSLKADYNGILYQAYR